jgi:flagellar basal-body rod modification protein FlgD
MTVSSTTSDPYASLVSNSTVSPGSSAASSASASGTGSIGNPKDLSQTFLKLLVAQMNNQDPLNPVDNNQITTQMAQISTVTGIGTLNTSVTSMMTQLQQSSALQSAQLTGHSVMVQGANLSLASNGSAASGQTAVGAFSLGAAASNVTVTVKDASGQTVNTLNLGAQPAGLNDFTWDGSTSTGATAAAGNYTFSVNATSASGTSVSSTAYNAEPIIGTVPQTNGSLQLMLGNGTQVPYTSVAQII